MAHFIRFVQARKIKKKWKHYLEEKEIGLNANGDESDSEFSRTSESQVSSWWLVKIKTPKGIEHAVWKSFLGFSVGVLLAYAFFFFFHLGVNFSVCTSTYVCGLAGIVLCLGLAFSSKVRCYVLLLLSVFFSKQGRQALLTYALFLAFTGPGRNTMHNMEVLSESMSCGQEMVKRTLKQINDTVKVPIKSMKETMQKMVKALKEALEAFKGSLMKIRKLIVIILSVINKVTVWLKSIVNYCNMKIGTPFQRCMKAFDEAIADCKAKLGVIDFVCHVVHIVKALCYSVKFFDFICLITDFNSEKTVGIVKKKLQELHFQLKNLFYVSLEFSHSYEFRTSTSNTTKAMSKTILQKLSKKMEKLQTIFSFCGFVFSLFFVFLFLKVYYYRYKYLSSDRYDNVYISQYIIDLDVKRAQMDKETVLPLEPREKKLYAKPTSIRLLKIEKNRIAESIFLLSLTSFKIITFVVVDYSLFWILMTVYGAGRNALHEVEVTKIRSHVEKNGILVDFYRKLGKTFRVPENPYMHLTPLHCLPDPAQPDLHRYIQIGFLVTLCWILTATEAYGLRLRNVVMSHYYPDRARERAIWLYNHIIRSRGSFIRYARRQLRKKCGNETLPREKVTLTKRLFANFPLLCAIFGKSNENHCLICETPDCKSQSLKRCRTPDCQGRYCLNCFASLENVCTICQHPIEYGDISDISEEIDSSEEDLNETMYKSSDGECVSDDSQKSEEFLTFKEMENRDKFRDVEANKSLDYAKLGDLYPDKASLQKRLKAVIQRHLNNIEAERIRAAEKKNSEYQKVREKLQNVICKLKNKKLEQIRNKKLELKQSFLEIINTLRALKENKAQKGKNMGECSKKTESKVSFSFVTEENEEQARCQQQTFKELKDELRMKIECLKKRRNMSL